MNFAELYPNPHPHPRPHPNPNPYYSRSDRSYMNFAELLHAKRVELVSSDGGGGKLRPVLALTLTLTLTLTPNPSPNPSPCPNQASSASYSPTRR